MGTEGTRGGAENRPASAPEISKLPTYVCELCGLGGVSAIVAPNAGTLGRGRCRNTVACAKRAKKLAAVK